ncbi:MAG: hypothetical protein A2X22_04540 [Bacteroidetes bacterium GWF2_49_14]|nr:MAG: hypothetical protein A2X22_04540 [Bacteroidetes bacterium GWF2_49_14]HBB92742.1 hypothetical protein [Bacteroidales bacterium]
MRILPIIWVSVSALISIPLFGQNKFYPPDPYTDWDGITHKSRYLITSPGYMGPNALPVPFLHKGLVPERVNWSGRYEYYLGKGNQTQDFHTDFVVPISDRVGLEFSYAPVEFFSMDSATSRNWRTYSGMASEGQALGDIYFGTMFQLVRDHQYIPDITFAMTCRTASGTGREFARHTDTPGYHLDMSVGDSYGKRQGFFQFVRWYAETGFLVWQTYLDNYPQDDAWLYGLGLDLEFRDFYVNQSYRGYTGYMNNGDKPQIYQADLGIRIGRAALVFGYQKGFRDYPFQCFRAGISLNGLK